MLNSNGHNAEAKTQEQHLDKEEQRLGKAFGIIKNAFDFTVSTNSSAVGNIKKAIESKEAIIQALRADYTKEDALLKDAVLSNAQLSILFY